MATSNWSDEVELDELREKAVRSRKKNDIYTGYREYIMPTMQGISCVFEGFQSMEDMICCEPYDGVTLNHHRDKRVYVPRLHDTSSASGEAVRVTMETVMRKKIKEIIYIYDPHQDGELDMCIKFGKVYTIDTPVGHTMTVKRIVRVLPGERKQIDIHPAFAPVPISNTNIEQALKACGFKQKCQNEYVHITAIHSRKDPFICFNIDLDENLNFRYLSPVNTKYASIDIIAADASHADLRVLVTSSQKFTDPSSTVGVARDYMRDDWVSRDSHQRLVINTDNPLYEKMSYASTRKESVYVLQNPRSLHSAFEKNVHVRVQEATHYDNPQNGRFRNVETRSEVFMHVTTKDAIAEVAESPDFIHSLLSFSFRLNPQ